MKLLNYFMTAQWIEQMMKSVSITKHEVGDEEFQFRQTFITCLRNCPLFGTRGKVLFF
jgi:hypothetical protein